MNRCILLSSAKKKKRGGRIEDNRGTHRKGKKRKAGGIQATNGRVQKVSLLTGKRTIKKMPSLKRENGTQRCSGDLGRTGGGFKTNSVRFSIGAKKSRGFRG